MQLNYIYINLLIKINFGLGPHLNLLRHSFWWHSGDYIVPRIEHNSATCKASAYLQHCFSRKPFFFWCHERLYDMIVKWLWSKMYILNNNYPLCKTPDSAFENEGLSICWAATGGSYLALLKEVEVRAGRWRWR